jgi:hypothetical protein
MKMNVLPTEKQVQVVSALVEGNSIRATARMVGIEHKTVMRVLLRVGERCEGILDERMRKLPCRIMQADEIWTFVGKKEKRVGSKDNREIVGDQYVFVAMDSESKVVPCYRVGKRNAANTWYFVQDLQARLAHRVQLTTDGFKPYPRRSRQQKIKIYPASPNLKNGTKLIRHRRYVPIPFTALPSFALDSPTP